MRIKKLLTSRWFVIGAVVLVLAAVIILGALPGSPINFGKIGNGLGGIFKPVQNVVRNIGQSFDDFHSAVFDGIAIRKENEELRSEIAQLQYKLRQNTEAAIRYEELKDAFHIKDNFSNFDVYGAPVLSTEADEWFSSVRVGVGKDNGLELNQGLSYVVVDVKMNLVGRVIEVSDSESRILPIIHEGFAVSCKVNTVNGSNFLLTGNTALKTDGNCILTAIDPNNIPEVGSEIVTSGEGGLFPEGIPVGKVISVDTSNPMNVTAVLEPYSSIGRLQDVFILVPLAEESQKTDAAPQTAAATEPEG